jgi:hypothetical protein
LRATVASTLRSLAAEDEPVEAVAVDRPAIVDLDALIVREERIAAV